MKRSKTQPSLFPRQQFLATSIVFLVAAVFAKAQPTTIKQNAVPRAIHVQILQAEDERRWDATLSRLLKDKNPAIRARAALAAGRIGDDQALASLNALLRQDKDSRVRAMAAFSIGEIESARGADDLISIIKNESEAPEVRARAIEGLGKIAAALPREQEERARHLGAFLLESLRLEGDRKSPLDNQTIIVALTAVLRSRPANAGPVIGGFLRNRDPRVRADAANVLARLRLKDANYELRSILTADADPIVRANAARVLGATEEKSASAELLNRSVTDADVRVRVSAIRALASVKDASAIDSLLKRANSLLVDLRKAQGTGIKNPPVQNEILEIAATLGRLLSLSPAETKFDKRNVEAFFLSLRGLINPWATEIEGAYARALPHEYVAVLTSGDKGLTLHWRSAASVAQALGEIPALPHVSLNTEGLLNVVEVILRDLLDNDFGKISISKTSNPEYAVPEILRALAALKPGDLGSVLRRHLNERDVVVRSTAADLIGDLPPSEENTRALISSLALTNTDDSNDAALSILSALAKQKSTPANEIIKNALLSTDPLVRRRAATLLKANGPGESINVGTVKTRNTRRDYERALSRANRPVAAVVTTSKGSFTIELLPGEAPLTVDNFILLAQRSYFREIAIHRVVPNFVIQDGDPRGDGNGGPGYQIRCEINQVPYERATVGMALSGKDTGGSQWFVTHSRQPHLDGGYTVFGIVTSGMEVVDSIVRGDIIRSVVIKQK